MKSFRSNTLNVILSVVLVSGLIPANASAQANSSVMEDLYATSSVDTKNALEENAIADEDPAWENQSLLETQAVTVTEGWTAYGTCEYQIDENGCLTIRPLGNGESGVLYDWGSYSPWCRNNSFSSVVINKGVSTQTCSYMFFNCLDLEYVDLTNLDISDATDISHMFQNCSKLTCLDLSSFNTQKVTDMSYMFYGCKNLKTIYVSPEFTTKNVTSSTEMFYLCKAIVGGNGSTYYSRYIDASRAHVDSDPDAGYFTSKTLSEGWHPCGGCEWMVDDSGLLTIRPMGNGEYGTLRDWSINKDNPRWSGSQITSVVIKNGVSALTCSGMFSGCSGLTSLDMYGLDTSGVTSMSDMFVGCKSLTSLHLSGLDTSNVTDMGCMFSDCSGLTSLDLSGFDTSNVTDMVSMFSGCSSLTSLDLSGFDTSNVTDTDSMFYGCSGLTSLDLSGFDTSNVTDMDYMFYNCTGLASLNVSGFDTAKVTSMNSMFRNCSILTHLDLSSFAPSNVDDMYAMFSGCTGLTELNLSNFHTHNATVMSLMFDGCANLTSLDLSSFDTANVTVMYCMFYGCSGITSLNLSNFNTSQVTSMGGMFGGCCGLTFLDVSRFDTSNVTNMNGMFRSCSNLTSLNLSGFDTGNVTNMVSMFNGCSKLKTIYATENFTSGATEWTSGQTMFDGCVSLVGGAGTTYISIYDEDYARIDGLNEMRGYFTQGYAKGSGDINNNGVINIVDAQITYDLATTEIYKDCEDFAEMHARADATGDGVVRAEDAFAVQYRALRGIWGA